MRPSFILVSLTGLALAGSASAQSAFSARGGNPPPSPLAPVPLPPITVTKPAAPQSEVAPVGRSDALPPGISGPRTGVPAAGSVPALAAQAGVAGAAFRPGESFLLRMSGMPLEDAASYALEFTIGGDGFVNIPLGGQVRAAGLTQSQLERAIERRLVEQKIFRWPTATINVPNAARFVTIGGTVRNPSRQLWSPDLTITSAISMCSGPGDFASDKVNLIRSGTITQYRLKKLKANPANDPRLLPGDQVELL